MTEGFTRVAEIPDKKGSKKRRNGAMEKQLESRGKGVNVKSAEVWLKGALNVNSCRV